MQGGLTDNIQHIWKYEFLSSSQVHNQAAYLHKKCKPSIGQMQVKQNKTNKKTQNKTQFKPENC